MLELILKKLIYKLDFIDLSILETIIQYDYSISLPILTKRLNKINVWNKNIIRRRIKRLREFKIVHFEDKQSPIIIEVYQHKEEEFKMSRDLLKQRLLRY